MAYINPSLVLSPKGRIRDLHVLYDGGQGDFSIASMTWDGTPGVIGVRWNGGTNEGLGNPQSRGIATWFILPEPLAPLAADWAGPQAPVKGEGELVVG